VEGFQSRADAVRRLLRDSGTAALMVTSAEPLTVDETISFYWELDRAGLFVGAVVLNRTVPDGLLARTRGRTNSIPGELRRKLRAQFLWRSQPNQFVVWKQFRSRVSYVLLRK